MPEPFIPYYMGHDETKRYNVRNPETDEKIPLFRVSRLTGTCIWKYHLDLDKSTKRPITEGLEKIFDGGSDTHEEEENLNEGARNVLESEVLMIIVDEDWRYGITGHPDYFKFDYNGRYVLDMKSTSGYGGFYAFLNEWKDNFLFKRTYQYQLGCYSYMYFIFKRYYIKRGAIRKILRDNRNCSLQLESELPSKEVISKFLVNHPIIRYKIGDIDEELLFQLCQARFGEDDEWTCRNCQYAGSFCRLR